MPLDTAILVQPLPARRRRRRPQPRRPRRLPWWPAVLLADVAVGWSSGLGFTGSEVEAPSLRQGVALADAWVLGDDFLPLAQGVQFKGRWSADSGALSTDRSRGRNA